MGGGGAQVVRNATAGEAGPCPASVAALIRYLATKYNLTINVPVVYMVRVMDSPPSKPLCTAPYKQQVHWLFYVPAMDI